MATLTESNTSIRDRVNHISSRLIFMSLNIHIELNYGRFSTSCLNQIRTHSDLSLVSSSLSNTLIDELFECIKYYCHEINELADGLRLMLNSSSITIQILDDLSKGSQLCLNVLHDYHLDRIGSVQSMLSSPFREDAWYLVHELDTNIFGKCRIILIRLQIYFLLMHQILTNDIKSKTSSSSVHSLLNNKKRRQSNLSISNNMKRGKLLDFKM
jgi:hypothetical protein